jgi:hypothetical protein
VAHASPVYHEVVGSPQWKVDDEQQQQLDDIECPNSTEQVVKPLLAEGYDDEYQEESACHDW